MEGTGDEKNVFMTQDELLAIKERAIKELLFLEDTGEKIFLLMTLDEC